MERSRAVELTNSELRYILVGVSNDIEWNELEDYQIEKIWHLHNKIKRAIECIKAEEEGFYQRVIGDYQ
jgi:hypothetical protein